MRAPRPLPTSERTITAPTWPDEWIEHWAGVYLDARHNDRLRARGVRFETFLRAPREILAALDKPARVLEAQRAVRERLDRETALEAIAERSLAYVARESHCANGRTVEKLRHHAHPKSRAAFQGGR